jgi:glycosyltransferase involved in cell wall biosynthesis
LKIGSAKSLVGRRILLVGNDPEYFLMHRLALAKALLEQGIDLQVAVPFDPSDERFRALPFAVHQLPLKRGSVNPFSEMRALRALYAHARKLRPLVVHHVTIKPMLYGSIVARMVGTPCVVNSITGLGYVFASPEPAARVLRAIVRPMLRFGCVRPNVTMLFENRDDLELYCRERIAQKSNSRVIPSSGIDVSAYTPRQHVNGAVTVLLLGRMLWDKGIREFIEAARAVGAQRPGTRFVLVGGTDPNPESIPLEVLRTWQQEGVVEYWGWRADIPAVLAQADILCLPSYREGLPRSMLEGGAAGLPLIATDVPGCRDAMLPGKSGLLVPPKDSAALSAAILRLVDNVDLRRAMGRAARHDAASRFSTASVASSTLSVYEEALERLGIDSLTSSG